MSQPKRLFLLDGMAILFRGYFALITTHLTGRNGEPTGGTFAFCTALVRLLEQHKPDLIAVAWDSKEPTFRHEQFTDYKANRDEFPEDLAPQLARVKDIVKLYHIPSLEMPGFEADDIIGTLARRAEREGYEVFCVTPDKDYFQLVTDNIKIYRPSKPGVPEEIVDIEGVARKFGVTPDRVIDVLALMGDSSDNVPGVKGIGEKTAIPLIQEFGTVEALYEGLESVPKAGVKKKLEEGRDNAFLSKELVTIHTEVPVEVTFEELHLDPPNLPALIRMYDELGFKSLVTRYKGILEDGAQARNGEEAADGGTPESGNGVPAVDGAERAAHGGEQASPAGAPAAETPSITFHLEEIRTIADVPHSYSIIRTEDELAAMVKHLLAGPVLSFDLETDGLDWQRANIIGFSFATQPGEAFYVPVMNAATKTLEENDTLFGEEKVHAATEGLPLDVALRHLAPLLENPSLPKTGQNGKFDMLLLLEQGIHVAPLAFDSMLASYVLDSSGEHNMDDLSERYLNYRPVSITELIGERGKGQLNMRDIPVERVGEYAAEDADITLQLYRKMKAALDEQNLTRVAERFEFPLVEVLASMEHCGIYIDEPSLKEISKSLEQTAASLEEEIHELAGEPFNIGSPKQLAEILFEKLKLPTKKKTKTGYSTDQFVMEELAALHPLPEKILEYRQAMKLKGTYVDAIPSLINPKTGRVHTSYNQAVAATGRLSSNNPNLQNIPIRSEMGREIRKAFSAGFPDGVIVSADYSQIELRIMAHVCGDEAMVRAFRENADIHMATAMKVFNLPKEQVTANMRRKAKEVNFGIMYGIGAFGLARRLKIGQKEAKDLITAYFQNYPGVQEYINRTVESARELGYAETLSGRRRYFPNIKAANQAVRAGDERAAINMPIQGTASDIIKLAMINIHAKLHGVFPKANMLLQVHDELVFEVPREESEPLAAFVKEQMETAFPLGEVPVVVDTGIGANWFEAH
ncbi:MAG: DNA polymerase I [Bacteroidetes bacterium]|nr:DNA polymerase I [Bacteroidota bacterium]